MKPKTQHHQNATTIQQGQHGQHQQGQQRTVINEGLAGQFIPLFQRIVFGHILAIGQRCQGLVVEHIKTTATHFSGLLQAAVVDLGNHNLAPQVFQKTLIGGDGRPGCGAHRQHIDGDAGFGHLAQACFGLKQVDAVGDQQQLPIRRTGLFAVNFQLCLRPPLCWCR